MISSISNVKFCGDVPNTSSQDLINSPGKFTTAAAPMANADQPADTFESPKKKSNTGKVIGGVIAVLAAVWIGLGVAVGKGKMTKAIAEEGKNLTFGEKAKNIAYEIGVSAKKCWDAVFNRSRKAADEVADAADDAGKGKTGQEVKGKTEPEVKGKTEPEVNGKTEPEVKGKTEPEVNGKTEPEVNGKTEPEVEGKTEPKVKGKTETKKQKAAREAAEKAKAEAEAANAAPATETPAAPTESAK